MELGRIVGRNVTEAKFRCPYGEYLALGEIVVVEDAETVEPYYLRVFNVTYGAEASGDDWFERTAGHMLAMDGAEMEYGFADKERRLYKLASASVLGVLRDGNFRRAKGVTLKDRRLARRRLPHKHNVSASISWFLHLLVRNRTIPPLVKARHQELLRLYPA